jgi:erythromycin esterase
MKRIYFALLLALLICLLTACGHEGKEILTLDFEGQTLDNWKVSRTGYKVSLDSTASEGKQSLSLQFVKEVKEYSPGFAVTGLPVKEFRGKRMRLTASLKTADTEIPVSLWLRADKDDDPLAFTNLGRWAPKGSTEWKTFNLEMDVPAETTSLYFGAGLRGKGRVWVDDIVVSVLPAKGRRFIVISGKVVDEKDRPVPGALAAVKFFFHETALALTVTDEKGEFSFRLPPGEYRLSATAQGLTAASLPPDSYDQDKKDQVIRLKGKGFTVRGKINTAGGALPPDSYVVAYRLDFFDADMYYFRPSADGSFKMTLPAAPEGFKIDLDAPGLNALAVQTGPGDKAVCTLETAAPEDAPEAVVEWIKKEAVPLKSVEAGQGYDDLHALKKIIGNARVVGFGESSHGQREIFQMKHRMLEFLVEEMGFTVFAMEEAWAHGFDVNDYVLHGEGDIRSATGSLHGMWDTEEVYALVEWMRQYNADPAHEKKVKFYGLDLFYSKSPADMVAGYVEKTDRASAKKVAEALEPLRSREVWNILYKYDEKQSSALREKLKDVSALFDDKKEAYIEASSKQEWSLMRRHAEYLRDFTDYALYGKTSDVLAIDVRDKCQAETVKWILDNEPPGTRVALWAHNFHISAAPYPGHPFTFAGIHLKKTMGDDYLSVGFVFNRGGFQSFDMTAQPTFFLLKGFNAGPYPGSYGAAMARTGMPVFFLDLRTIPSQGVVHDWFAAPHTFLWIDSVYASEKDIKYQFKLPGTFDAVIFIEETSRARPNYPRSLLKFF